MKKAKFRGFIKFTNPVSQKWLDSNFPSNIGGSNGDIQDFSIEEDGSISGIIATHTKGMKLEDFVNLANDTLLDFDRNVTKVFEAVYIFTAHKTK
jgi:hypothetical protein